MPAVRTAGAGLPYLIGQLVEEPLTQGGSESIGTPVRWMASVVVVTGGSWPKSVMGGSP